MDVSTAVDRRRTVRAFLPDPVPDEVIARLLTGAARAPSGGNVQPWRVYVVNGEATDRFRPQWADLGMFLQTFMLLAPPASCSPRTVLSVTGTTGGPADGMNGGHGTNDPPVSC